MGSYGVKNAFTTLFLIMNTICGLSFGILLASYLVGLKRTQGDSILDYGGIITVTVLLLGVSLLGYVGAIFARKKMLLAYSGLLGLLAVSEAVGLSINTYSQAGYIYFVTIMGFHTGVSFLSIVLGVILAIQIFLEECSEALQNAPVVK